MINFKLKNKPTKLAACLGLSLLTLGLPANAEKPLKQELSQAAADPTASLMTFQISDWNTYNYHDSNFHSNQVVIRTVYPFQMGEQKHIMRMTAPFITDHPRSENGLSDITLFDLLVFETSWGRWGAGPLAVVPTGGSKRGAEQWALGPAIGFMVQKPNYVWGIFNQNAFTIAGDDDRKDTKVSSYQPIGSYKLGSGWSVGLSEMQVTYNWTDSRWSNLPLGAGFSKIQRFGRLPVRFNLQYEHNFADNKNTPSDTVRLNVKFLFPTF